jgi:dCMP deaminase
MKRPSIDEYYLNIAKAVSERSTCLKKHYGAVLVKNGEIISTGYNNPPRGEPHCWKCTKCNSGKDEATYLSCPSVHAEQNAIISASRNEMLGADLYLAGYDVKTGEAIECEAWPCEICLRLIKNAGIYRIINSAGVIYMRLTEDPNSEMIQFIEKRD